MARFGDRLGRWVRGSATGRLLGSHLGALYIRLVLYTTRWEIVGRENFDNAVAGGTGVIGTVWHGRLFMSPTLAPSGRRSVAMISNNRDGDLISAVVRRFGIFSVRGSTYDHAKGRDKGGAAAYSGAIDELVGRKAVLAVTPDGPRGPRMRAQRGAAMLAIRTGVPVVPFAFSVSRGKTMRSWDRFLFPSPFGRGVQIFGPAATPPADPDERAVDAFLARIEDGLTEITNRADVMCGRTPVEPGPPIDRP